MCGNWLSSVARGFGLNWPRRLFATASNPGHAQKLKNACLLVVDVQNDFISGSLALSGCPSKHKGEEIIPPINKLVTLPWGLIVYTRDWHPSDHISFVSSAKLFKPHADNKVDLSAVGPFDEVCYDVNGALRRQVLYPAHCVQNTEGAELHRELIVPDGSVVLNKGTASEIDSYSAFFDNERLSQTELASIIKKKKMEKVYCCGLASDICVQYTANDSVDLGFPTYVIEDCCRGADEGNIATGFAGLKERGVTFVTSEEILESAPSDGHPS